MVAPGAPAARGRTSALQRGPTAVGISRSFAFVAAAVGLGLVMAGCTASPDTTVADETGAPGSASAPGPAETDAATAVIVDYSPTVSDVGGLMYLLTHPDIDVIAVSLPVTGEAGCDLGVEVTLGVLALFDRADIPVACDPEVPADARPWPPEFLAAQGNLRFALPSTTARASDLSAPDLIAAAAAEASRPVVLYAVAPLTNVARALDEHPDLAAQLARIVIMGGSVDAPGNVQGSNAEWNLWIDVPAAARVISSGVPVTLVPLDATNDVPVPVWYSRALADAEQSEAIAHLNTMVGLFRSVMGGSFYFWDELAAAVVTEPDLVSTEEMTIRVVEGGNDDGRTIRARDGYPTTVAVDVPDPDQFYGDFLEILSGAPVVVGKIATPQEEAYLLAVEASLIDVAAVLEDLASDPASGAYDGPASAEAVDRLLEAGEASLDVVVELTLPSSLQDVHDNYVDVMRSMVERREETVAAVAETTSSAEFERIPLIDPADACEPMTERAAMLGVDIQLPC